MDSTGSTRLRRIAAFAVTAISALAIAQLGSYLVDQRLPMYETYVVNPVLHLTHIRNPGGVFGLFPGNGWLFGIASGLTIVGLSIYVATHATMKRYQYICFGLIVGAAASNVCDRLVYGTVIDFIDVQGIPRWHYIFNIADLTIHLGVWPLLIGSLIASREAARPPTSSE